MGTKQNPGRYDCEHAALPDEPRFTLLARDPDAPALVHAWSEARRERVLDGSAPLEDINKAHEAAACADAMRTWRTANMGAWRRPQAATPAKAPAGYQLDWARRNRLAASLAVSAPHADTVIVNMVAGVLAGSACSDALLIMADALEEQSTHLASRTGDFALERLSLQALATVLRNEAPSRAAVSLFAVNSDAG